MMMTPIIITIIKTFRSTSLFIFILDCPCDFLIFAIIMVIIIFVTIVFISQNAQIFLFKTLGIYLRKKVKDGTRTERSAKVKEESQFPLKPKKNGILSMTRFKIAAQYSVAHVIVTSFIFMINGTLAQKKKAKGGPG